MKKTTKICLCMLTIALVISSFTLTCFADNWGNIAPNSERQLRLPINTPSWNSTESIEYLCDMADKAYEIGLFGGGAPVAIIAQVTESDILLYVVAQPAYYPFSITTQNKRDSATTVTASGVMLNRATNPNNNTTYTNNISAFALCSEGSFTNINNNYVASLTMSNASTGRKVLAVWVYDHWETTPTSVNAYYSNIGITNEAVPQVYKDIMRNYVNATTNTTISYTLDIPTIITSIPNSAKQIINNAFGFEIFGINVAGLLSVLLIVTIVSFVVKWLMSR